MSYAGFSSVKLNRPSRSAFDMTHDKRLTTRMGRLTPVLIQEAIPSDSFRGSSEILMRLAPLLAPIYDQIELYVHYFFVPNRLLWEDWEEFITGGRLGVGVDPVTAPVPPYFDIGTMIAAFPSYFAKSDLLDYLGVPLLDEIDPTPANWDGLHLDAMPVLAYQLVWYEYYRDRNFYADDVLGFSFPEASGEVTESNYLGIQLRDYAKDYFHSALPFTQRGQEVLMPIQLGGIAPLYGDPVNPASTGISLSGIEQPGSVATGYIVGVGVAQPPGEPELYVRGEDFDGTSTSINDFRSAYALQVWLERNAIGGSRYTESTQAHFGVKPQDSRLQRPEYIGGGRIPVRISEVVSTAWSTDGSNTFPQANMAGHGITYGNTNQFNYFCTEHGFIIGIASIMNPPSYNSQGLPRMFRRRSFLDYPWPTFAKLGEQEVSDFEIFCTPASLTEDVDGNVPLFGYQSRYADWKYICGSNHGDFRDTLLFWTLASNYASAPVLDATFNIFDNDTQNRIFAVEGDEDNFWLYVHNKVMVKRALPYFGTPNTLGFGN